MLERVFVLTFQKIGWQDTKVYLALWKLFSCKLLWLTLETFLACLLYNCRNRKSWFEMKIRAVTGKQGVRLVGYASTTWFSLRVYREREREICLHYKVIYPFFYIYILSYEIGRWKKGGSILGLWGWVVGEVWERCEVVSWHLIRCLL